MSPRPRLDHVRRPALLAAAAEVIRERGLENARVADVAERAGTSAPSVLYWFASKGELLTEALTSAEERFYEQLDRELAALDSARERLVRLIESGVGRRATTTRRSGSSSGPRRCATRSWPAPASELDQRWRRTIADDRARRAGGAASSGAADPDEFALLLASLLDGLSVQIALGDRRGDAGAASRELCLRLAERELGCDLGRGGMTTHGGDRVLRSDLNRRELLRGGAGLALTRGLAGCGVGNSGMGSKEDTEKPIAKKIDGDLVYFNWAEYIDPALLKGFEKRYGVKVRESNFDSMPAMMAKLRAGHQLRRDLPERRVHASA